MSEFTERPPAQGIKWDAAGLLPCVLQDARSGEVLTLAYMNAESFKHTLETGLITFWSRSRKQLWVKGETSGNIMRVAELKLDCDGDALVARVLPEGPACHTGDKSCFFSTIHRVPELIEQAAQPALAAGWGARFGELLEEVRTLLQSRRQMLPEGSYSTYLFTKGLDKILKKLGEECTETVIAAKGDNKPALTGELCDMLFHMLVLMVEKEISLEELRRVMQGRHKSDQGKRDTSPVVAAVKVSRPEGCDELEQRLLKQLDPAIHRDVIRALEVMYRAHAGQKREEGVPYARHPLSVALIAVEEVKMRERVDVLAALLHDVLEDDMKTTPQQLAEQFGDEAAGAVVLLTKMFKRDGTPKELGLQRYYEGLRGAPAWVKAVKLCDRVHNLRSLRASGRSKEEIEKYRKETRANLLPLAASSVNQSLLKAGELLLQELYRKD